MIKEIVQFVDALPQETFSKNLRLKEGLYLFLELEEQDGEVILKNVDENGNLSQKDYTVFKNGDESPLIEDCKKRTAFIDPVSSNKAWNRSIFGLSCNPFALCFKKEHFIDEKKHSKTFVNSAIEQYFKNSKKYWNDSEYENEISSFENFLKFHLWDFLEDFTPFKELGKKNVFVFKKVDDKKFEELYYFYLKDKIFNKDAYNKNDDKGQVWGVSDDLSTFAEKKLFLKHQTSIFNLNYRVNGSDAISINKFMKMDLPKPIPIFLNQEELNRKIISLFKDDRKRTIKEIFTDLYKNRSDDLHNYYLLFWSTTKTGRKILDLDFVPRFKFYVNKKVENIFMATRGGDFLPDINIKNVFDLEQEISKLLFVQKNKKTEISVPILFRHYFSDKITADKGFTISLTTINNLYKYRKAWYNYVYKSKHNEITCEEFDKMISVSILEDIKLDEKRKNDLIIRKKLNLWFGLNSYFSQNKNRINMTNKTKELKEQLEEVIDNNDVHITSNESFAFASGQVIFKLLIQNESANRTHALLEPFLQKTEVGQFKLAIARTFDTYKHKFKLYPKKYGFDKLMSEIMGFETDVRSMKDLLPFILAGYFSESLFIK